MNALLRIQVKVLSQEANSMLRALAEGIRRLNSAGSNSRGNAAVSALTSSIKVADSELRKISKNLAQFGSDRSFRAAAADAENYKKKIDDLNRSIGAMTTSNRHNGPFSLIGGETENVRRGQAAAAKAAANEAQAISAQQNQVLRSQWRQQQTAYKQMQREQSMAAKTASIEEAAAARQSAREATIAARQAAAEQKAIEEGQAQFLKQKWNQQQVDFKEMKRQETAAARAAAAEQRTIEARGIAAGSMTRLPGGSVAELTTFGRMTQKINGDLNHSRRGILQMGKDLQWIGRQINFNFTVPLVLAARSSVGMALDIERAFTRLVKVYGDGSRDITAETQKIAQGVRMLSDIYAENQSEVMDLAAAWAAAGLEGGDLLAAVQNSLNLAILGDYQKPIDTFQALIAIQQAYKLSSEGLATAIAKLNLVENTQAVNLQDLVTVISLTGSSARTAGVDMEHLAAMTAVLVPATGSAARAGNALKTILTNLVAPTDKIVSTLKDMGIEFYSTSFQSKNAAQRLEEIATTFQTLSDGQQAFVGRTLGNLWQVDKFNQLMRDLASSTSTYAEVLNDITGEAGAQKSMAAMTNEIQTLLNSDPKKFERVVTVLKNMFAEAVVPLIPVLINFLGLIKGLVEWFTSLNPNIQRAAGFVLLLVAAIGVVAQAFGSVQLLFGTFAKFILFLIGLIPGVGLTAQGTAAVVAASSAEVTAAISAQTVALTAAISGEALATTGILAETAAAQTGIVSATSTAQLGIFARMAAGMGSISSGLGSILASPWTWLVLAIIAAGILIYKNWDSIVSAFEKGYEAIARGVSALPGIMASALMGVLHVVASIMKAIIHWLSYLNPFQRHSPSLVENVTAGVAAIRTQYESLRGITGIFRESAADLERFNQATADAKAQAKNTERADTRAQVIKYSPEAGPSLDALFNDLDKLNAELASAGAAVDAQQQVVDGARAAYDDAAAAVDSYAKSMQPLRDEVDRLDGAINASKARIEELSNTAIEGMGAMEDAAFDNQMAQNRLRLEILKMEEAGQAYDDIKDKIAGLNGDIENIRGTMTTLRQAGAGSDILGFYQDQLDALEAQKKGLVGQAANTQSLTDQLEKLRREAEMIDLEKSLKFDPLTRQIEKLTKAQKEMSFEDIINGIKDEQENLKNLTKDYEDHKAELDNQEAVLKALEDTRDKLNDTYDKENKKLAVLKDTYDKIANKIRDIESAIDDAVNAFKTLNDAAGGGAGGGGGFEDLGDYMDQLPDALENVGIDIDKILADLQKQLNAMFGKFDPLQWLKDRSKDLAKWVWDKFILPLNLALWAGMEWIKGSPAMLLDLGRWIVEKIWEGVTSIWGFLLAPFIGLPATIAVALGNWGDDLFNIAYKAVEAMRQGIDAAIGMIWDFFIALPGTVLEKIGDVRSWLWQTGVDFITGLLGGVSQKAQELIAWFRALPTNVLSWVGDVAVTLWNKGVDFISGMLGGINEKAHDIAVWAIGLPSALLIWIGDVLGVLWQKGWDFIAGMFTGIGAMFSIVGLWFMNLPNVIKGWFIDAGKWLINAGVALVKGLYDGIVNAPFNIAKALADKIPGAGVAKDVFGGIKDHLPSIPNPFDFGAMGGVKQGWTIVGERGPELAYFDNASRIFNNTDSRNLLRDAMRSSIPSYNAVGNTQGGEGTTTLHFYGDLSFPNISDPNDADALVKNLVSLAGG